MLHFMCRVPRGQTNFVYCSKRERERVMTLLPSLFSATSLAVFLCCPYLATWETYKSGKQPRISFFFWSLCSLPTFFFCLPSSRPLAFDACPPSGAHFTRLLLLLRTCVCLSRQQCCLQDSTYFAPCIERVVALLLDGVTSLPFSPHPILDLDPDTFCRKTCWELISAWRGAGVANASHGRASPFEPIRSPLDRVVPGSDF